MLRPWRAMRPQHHRVAAVASEAPGSPAAPTPTPLSPRQRKLAAKRQQKHKQASPGTAGAPKQEAAAALKLSAHAPKQEATARPAACPATQPASKVSQLPGAVQRLKPSGRQQESASADDVKQNQAAGSRGSTPQRDCQQSTGVRQASPQRQPSPQREYQQSAGSRCSSPSPQAEDELQGSTGPIFPGWGVFEPAPDSCTIASLSNAQLVQLVQHWAAEIATSLNHYAAQQLQAATRSATEGGSNDNGMSARGAAEDGLKDRGTVATRAAAAAATTARVKICAQAPSKWWAQLSLQQQKAACQNVQTAAEVALARLSSSQRQHCISRGNDYSQGLDAGCDVSALHPLISSRLPAAYHTQTAVAMVVDGDDSHMHTLGTAVKRMEAHMETASSVQPLTQQQLTDAVWSLAHLTCANDRQLNAALQQLQRAMGVPYVMLPVCLPGLNMEWFHEEVELRQDTIYLDGGTRAVQEARLTGWQSDGGHTFKYSGKEMQPQPGGLSPAVAQVREELKRVTGVTYDSVLVNFYPDGQAGMRYHVDPLYGCWTPESSVVSIGRPRTFVFREMNNHASRWSYTVCTGDLCVMFNDCQDRLQHAILTEKGQPDGDAGRISLVFKQRIAGM